MNNSTQTVANGFSTGVVVTQYVLFAVGSHLAIVGNIVLLVTVYKRPVLHRVTYYFVSALAVEDLLASLSNVGFYPQQRIRGDAALSLPACGVYVFFSLFYGSCELYLMGAISLDRYIACCRPLQYSNMATPRRCAMWKNVQAVKQINYECLFTLTLYLLIGLIILNISFEHTVITVHALREAKTVDILGTECYEPTSSRNIALKCEN
ncbi:putative olfactory receptor 13C6 [Liolophura sinensis]|uniref:putative olfactory receptor 13C6 n=1 Tax=Liolophura sinensis TaxID=3198878 RepID=UPI0031589826